MPKYGLHVMTHVIYWEQTCKDKPYSNQEVWCECQKCLEPGPSSPGRWAPPRSTSPSSLHAPVYIVLQKYTHTHRYPCIPTHTCASKSFKVLVKMILLLFTGVRKAAKDRKHYLIDCACLKTSDSAKNSCFKTFSNIVRIPIPHLYCMLIISYITK